ncbi:hypothetical protein BC939DRAFT_485061 [Gamsiella multidivaricata]|uniref:uncharacterized protein n=1 Tax=Gamsiella multidivaricata TaxID=101098 RepID=UPI00221F605C|nr:uncharacterized protein BC939DRAFT_485061 [Gamsiella multidivaricata]KAI7818098.1 hypothetical protein BC939DRAFT_485061 [Gamsiella multidivaricata]
MNYWLKGSSPIDDLVGSEDLALNLEICDQIRSKQVSSKDAIKALKRRISHKNPNVQLLALGLTDVCVKNGGQHFLVEVASREFVDNLTSILKAPAGCNLEVKNKILTLLQIWGRLFRGKQGLGYVCDTYLILQHEGYEFPPVDNVGAALVETPAPPDWTDSDVCTRCRTAFTLTNRKHHCRACGSTFCGQCSSKTMSLPHLGVNQEVRVCDGCWIKKKMGGKGTAVHDSFGLGGPAEFVPSTNSPKQTITSTSTNAQSSNLDNEDDDLKKAIELSLKEANSRPGYSAPSAARNEPISRGTTGPSHEEDDADLLAAIEASLKETKLSGSQSKQSAYETYTYTKPEVSTTVSAGLANDLTSTEKENIEMFSSLVDRIQMTNGDVAGNREVQALYEQISKFQMKLALSIEEADKKQREAIQFNEKIDQAVKMYDHLLQERLKSTYQHRINTSAYGYPGVQPHPAEPHVGYNVALPSQAVHNNPGYPHLTGSDPHYSPYIPGVLYNHQVPPSFAPQAPQAPPSQSSYQYQTSVPPATAPFDVSSSMAGSTGVEYASAPFASAPPSVQQIPAQTMYQPNQDLFSVVSPPGVQTPGQFQHQGYQPIATQQMQSTAVDLHGQTAYAPYQQQQAPYAPAAPIAPAAPVEEKPLIEL